MWLDTKTMTDCYQLMLNEEERPRKATLQVILCCYFVINEINKIMPKTTRFRLIYVRDNCLAQKTKRKSWCATFSNNSPAAKRAQHVRWASWATGQCRRLKTIAVAAATQWRRITRRLLVWPRLLTKLATKFPVDLKFVYCMFFLKQKINFFFSWKGKC